MDSVELTRHLRTLLDNQMHALLLRPDRRYLSEPWSERLGLSHRVAKGVIVSRSVM